MSGRRAVHAARWRCFDTMSELITLREAIDAITEAFDDGDGWDRYRWVYIRGTITESSCRLYLSHLGDEDDALIADHGEALPEFAAQHELSHFSRPRILPRCCLCSGGAIPRPRWSSLPARLITIASTRVFWAWRDRGD